ncbi:alpha/beta hydrolase fold domain-containing protein [Niabella aurantiaca]|uniref:alpha/beta hydrolase fold domain-containing protein n=1 Tax=Niabella aurantiaca TaxID=379900 RepID=UPI00036ED60D|nr:alpha/beta hydrolase fold domain-containing protein [Niabella aurantiaca]
MKRILLYTLCLSLFLTACDKDDAFKPDDKSVPPPSTAYTGIDESYGADPLQKMDIYLPAGRSRATTKVMILIHGGAWVIGDKADEDFAPVVDSLRRRLPDWAIFNLNYRLAGGFPFNFFPTQENDIKAAITYIYNQRTRFSISDKWVLGGASAGGHLALLQGYKNSGGLIKPRAIVNYFGPSDMQDMEDHPGAESPGKQALQLLCNGTEQASSPINYIDAQTPPTITLQGLDDQLVLPAQQEALHAKLQANGVPQKLEKYPGEGHDDFSAATMSKSFDQVQEFLNQHVK